MNSCARQLQREVLGTAPIGGDEGQVDGRPEIDANDFSGHVMSLERSTCGGRNFLMIPAEVIEEVGELGAEAQQRRAVSRRLAGRYAFHDHESILAELT